MIRNTSVDPLSNLQEWRGDQDDNRNGEGEQSFDLLVNAYNRIKDLQRQNEQLYLLAKSNENMIRNHNKMQEQLSDIEVWMKQKQRRIENLQKSNQKIISNVFNIKDILNCGNQEVQSVDRIPEQKQQSRYSDAQFNKENRANLASRSMSATPIFQTPFSLLQCTNFLKNQEYILINRQRVGMSRCYSFDKRADSTFEKSQSLKKQPKLVKQSGFYKQVDDLIKKVHHSRSKEKSGLEKYRKYCTSIEHNFKNNSCGQNMRLNQSKLPKKNKLKISQFSKFAEGVQRKLHHNTSNSYQASTNFNTTSNTNYHISKLNFTDCFN